MMAERPAPQLLYRLVRPINPSSIELDAPEAEPMLTPVLAVLLAATPAADPATVPLWSGTIPGPTSGDPANIPTLTVHLAPAGQANGCAVVVCPGGGYSGRATDH